MVLAPLFYAPAATFTLLAPLALWRCLWLPFKFKGKKKPKRFSVLALTWQISWHLPVFRYYVSSLVLLRSEQR